MTSLQAYMQITSTHMLYNSPAILVPLLPTWNFHQAKVLTGGGDLSEAQVDVPLYVSHSCVWSQSWAQ